MDNKYDYKIGKVIENIKVSDGIYKMTVEGDFKGRPGQFYMLRSWDKEPLLWRPISIHSVLDNGIEFLYQTVGDGTKLLSQLQKDQELKLIGPLGNGFNIQELKGRVALVAGGIGIAPMRYLAEELRRKDDVNVDLLAGFRDEIFGLEEIKESGADISIATETGKYGYKGYVTELLNPEKYDMVLCCGPEIMMFKVVEMCRAAGVKGYISEEKKMACGIGACLVCTCKTKKGNKRTCKDGPVFSMEEIEI